MRPPWKHASLLIAVLVLTAGCLGGVPGRTSPSPTDSTPMTTATASELPDPNKAVQVENAWNRSVELHLRVVRVATNETVYDQTLVLEPGEDRTVYNISTANPDGIESFRVVATARNTTESVTIETNACYGDAYVEIQEDGTLYPFYAIC